MKEFIVNPGVGQRSARWVDALVSMRALPVAARELQVAARRPKTHRWRLMMAAGSIVVVGWFLWVFGRLSGAGGAGLPAFSVLANVAIVYCLFAGASHTADVLSGEKREGTLGLLFLTDLSAGDIVLGKFFATSLNLVYSLMATFPVFAVALLAGGVQGMQVLQLALCLLNTIFFSLTAGLLSSAFFRDQKYAANGAVLLVLLFWLGARALSEWLRLHPPLVPVARAVELLSPGVTLDSIMGSTVRSRFWVSILAVHAVAWGFLILAGAVLDRTWQDRPSGRPGGRWRERMGGWGGRRRNASTALRQRLLDASPYLWLCARDRLRAVWTWMLIGIVLVTTAGFWWFFRPAFSLFAAFVVTSITVTGLLKLEFASTAARRLAEDRQVGALELVLATPLPVREILRGQWLALGRHFAGPVAAAVVLDGVMLLAWRGMGDLAVSAAAPTAWLPVAVVVVLVTKTVLCADLVAIGWMAMWGGLSARTPAQANGPAVFWVLLVPWLGMIGLGSGLAYFQPPWAEDLGFGWFFGTWVVLGLATDLVAVVWSRRRLHTRFRWMATQRFEAPVEGWGWFRKRR